MRRRIVEREWRQGDRIPDEADLATEFGAARATVNKALQLLADEGLLDRRRRAGTRVAAAPVRKATFTIPIIREQIEQAGMAYSHRVVARRPTPAPVGDRRCGSACREGPPLIHLRTVHYGDGRPFQLEDRWLNPGAIPGLESGRLPADERQRMAGPQRTLPARRPDLLRRQRRRARRAPARDRARGRRCSSCNRTTWNDAGAITTVRLACHPGYVMTAAT